MEGLLLVGHGTRYQPGNLQFLALAAALAERLPGIAVEAAFLEHAEPGIQAGIDRLAARGVKGAALLPLFLFAAGHARRDVPAAIALGRRRHPGLRLTCGDVLGVHPSLVSICAEHLTAAEAALPERDRSETAILLVGRGSSEPEANADLSKVARLLWEQTRYGLVECAYSDVTWPSVPEGLERCRRLGAGRIILLPYFLFRGVLMERLRAVGSSWQERHPGMEVLLAGEAGLSSGSGLLELVAARAEAACRAAG